MSNLKIRKEGCAYVINISSSLQQGDYLAMKDYFRMEMYPKGDIYVILDCKDAEELPSISFGAFCTLSREAKRVGGGCALINVGDSIRDVMRMIHVDKILQIYATMDAALASFTPQS
jgi:anti-anti-sigma factor